MVCLRVRVVGSDSRYGTWGSLEREAVRTLASPTQDGWTLWGRKDWVSRAQEADVVVVFARKPDDTIGGFVVSLPSGGALATIGTFPVWMAGRGALWTCWTFR